MLPFGAIFLLHNGIRHGAEACFCFRMTFGRLVSDNGGFVLKLFFEGKNLLQGE